MLPLRDHLPTRRVPFVTYAIIAANVATYLFERALVNAGADPQRVAMAWGLVPWRLLHDPTGAAFTIGTSMFLHDPMGWGHLLGNMLFMWIFADNVEDFLGHGRFLAFYLVCGAGAAAAQVLLQPTSMVPMLGASGAISGVLAAYGVLYPRAPVTVLNPVLPLWFFFGIFLEFPAWLVILEYFLVNLWSALTMSSRMGGGGIAFLAHLGGFVVGWLLIRWFLVKHMKRTYDPWHGWRAPPGRHSHRVRPGSQYDDRR